MDNYQEYQEYDDPYRQVRIKVVGPIAMAYVPMQKFRDLYDPEQAHANGTTFRELDLKFHGRGVQR